MLLVKMAFRNIWRRKFRTFITIFAIGLSYGLLIFFKGLSDGSHEQIANMGIKLQSGHVVIQEQGYQKEKITEIRITNPRKIINKIRNKMPDVLILSRIFTTGTLRSSEGSVILNNLIAVSPDKEKKISDIPRKLKKGTFLTSSEKPLKEILIGSKAASILNVSLGDKVVLIVSGLEGKTEELFRIKGIFTLGGDTDSGTAFIPLNTAQKLLSFGNSVSQISIFGDSIEDSESMAKILKNEFKGDHLEVLDWTQSLPTLYQLLWLDKVSMYIFLFIIFGIVAAGILNTVLMSVMERTKEIGILKSVGMKPVSVFAGIITEAFIVGLLSIIIGLLLGLPLYYYVHKYGIDPTVFTGGEGIEAAGVTFSDKMYSKLHIFSVVWTGTVVLTLTLASALYPAVRAARISPVDALRQ